MADLAQKIKSDNSPEARKARLRALDECEAEREAERAAGAAANLPWQSVRIGEGEGELAANWIPPTFTAYPVLTYGSVVMLIAPPKAGKSFVAVELAWAVASGGSFFGMYPVDEPGPVIYVAGEGADETLARFEVLRRRNSGKLPKHPLHLVSQPIDFGDEDTARQFADWCRYLGAKLVIVDTVARCGAGDEGAGDMGAFVRGITILDLETDATTFLLHHTPVATTGRSRGHSSLPAAVVAQWALDKARDGTRVLKRSFGRSTTSDSEELAAFTIENLDLATNKHGRKVGAGYVELVSPEARAARSAKATKATKPAAAHGLDPEKVLRMHREGMSATAIAKRIGGRTGQTLPLVKQVIEAAGATAYRFPIASRSLPVGSAWEALPDRFPSKWREVVKPLILALPIAARSLPGKLQKPVVSAGSHTPVGEAGTGRSGRREFLFLEQPHEPLKAHPVHHPLAPSGHTAHLRAPPPPQRREGALHIRKVSY